MNKSETKKFEILIILDLDNTLYNRSEQVPDNYTLDHIKNIKLFPGALNFLERFANNSLHNLVLVTKETDLGLQNKKIDALGIRKYFKKIIICAKSIEKKDSIAKSKVEFPSKKTFVVGDRIDSEIRYGNELDCTTIQIKMGNYKSLIPKDNIEIANFTIEKFEDITKIIN